MIPSVRVILQPICFPADPPADNQNFLIDVHGAGLKVLEALDMLADELPAELSFHIPESYHRRIIGKGGASVQDVMRRHSAFVKFSSTEQWATFGGHRRESGVGLGPLALTIVQKDNEDNVVEITPQKNRQGLVAMKQELMNSILTKVNIGSRDPRVPDAYPRRRIVTTTIGSYR